MWILLLFPFEDEELDRIARENIFSIKFSALQDWRTVGRLVFIKRTKLADSKQP